ncbi:Hypothetical protein NTJ_04614 [Nesidiocoris tenuis]|uniref:Uncharacterized protein n=1 Tax=Nesidiocoris tenuis TaxID=355587 RepID=A0ABN7AHR6_9HEMI|nr:Hypothetical protein NTJ_04614 [Nesidiocoris tenuis]
MRFVRGAARGASEGARERPRLFSAKAAERKRWGGNCGPLRSLPPHSDLPPCVTGPLGTSRRTGSTRSARVAHAPVAGSRC